MKLYARDKRHAETLMIDAVVQIASENGLSVEEDFATQIVSSSRLSRPTAYLAYAYSLLNRLKGDSEGPAVLALWRKIAWDPRGGMRRGFKLKLNDFKIAEETIVNAIREAK